MNILYQFNEKYAPFAGASIVSLFENNSDVKDINVYILGEGLTNPTIEKFMFMVEKYKRNIIFKDTSLCIEYIKSCGIPSYRNSYAANLRLFLLFF